MELLEKHAQYDRRQRVITYDLAHIHLHNPACRCSNPPVPDYLALDRCRNILRDRRGRYIPATKKLSDSKLMFDAVIINVVSRLGRWRFGVLSEPFELFLKARAAVHPLSFGDLAYLMSDLYCEVRLR